MVLSVASIWLFITCITVYSLILGLPCSNWYYYYYYFVVRYGSRVGGIYAKSNTMQRTFNERLKQEESTLLLKELVTEWRHITMKSLR